MKIQQCIMQNETSPYRFKDGKSIYTPEGMIMYAYTHWLEWCESVDYDALLGWIEQLGNHNFVTRYVGIQNSDLPQHEKYSRILTLLPIYDKAKIIKQTKKIVQFKTAGVKEQYKIKGDYYFALERYFEALFWYRKGLENSKNAAILNNMAIVHFKLYHYDEAKKLFKEAIEKEFHKDIVLNFVRLCRRLEAYEEALKMLFHAMKVMKAWEFYYECGKIYCMQAKWEEGLTAFNQAYSLFDNIKISKAIIETALKARKFSVAEQELNRLKACDKEAMIYYQAKILQESGKAQEAVELLERNKNTFHEKDPYYLLLAKIYKEEGHIIKAIACINNIHNHEQQDVLYEMISIAKKSGKYTDADNFEECLINLWKKKIRNQYS